MRWAGPRQEQGPEEEAGTEPEGKEQEADGTTGGNVVLALGVLAALLLSRESAAGAIAAAGVGIAGRVLWPAGWSPVARALGEGTTPTPAQALRCIAALLCAATAGGALAWGLST